MLSNSSGSKLFSKCLIITLMVLVNVWVGVRFLRVSSAIGQSACVTATAGALAQNIVFASQAGTFTAEFDSTPSAAPLNGVVGLSRGAQTAFSGFACLVSFSSNGQIVARNGGSYAASVTINYVAGVTYHFRLVVNVPAHTYSIFVTPQGGAEQTLGSNFAFRTEQNTIATVDNWGTFVSSTTGSLTTCNFTITGTPPTGGCGRTISVNNNSGLSAALLSAQPGDCIVLANGSYAGFTIARDGTSSAPIVIRAANRGGATISSGIIRLNGTSFVTVEGLNITTSGSTQTVDGESFPVGVWFDRADNSRITRSTFRLSGHANGTQFIMLGGNSNRNRIDHCEFGPNTVDGVHYIFVRGQRAIAGVTPDPLQDRGPWADGDGPVNPNIARNTQINNRPVIIGWSSRPLLPEDCVFANNISSGSATLLSASRAGNTIFSSNIANGNLGSSLPSSQFRLIDPLLATSGGILKLTSSSPSVNAANATYYSFVTDDADGQTRSTRDIGADEFSSATVTRRPLTTADVGPPSP